MRIFKKLFTRKPPLESPLASAARGAPIVVPFLAADLPPSRIGPHATLRERIENALDEVRPYLNFDGGDIEIVDVRDDGVVEMHFVGACHGCPSSAMTLKLGIEQTLRERVPEIKEVVAV